MRVMVSPDRGRRQRPPDWVRVPAAPAATDAPVTRVHRDGRHPEHPRWLLLSVQRLVGGGAACANAVSAEVGAQSAWWAVDQTGDIRSLSLDSRCFADAAGAAAQPPVAGPILIRRRLTLDLAVLDPVASDLERPEQAAAVPVAAHSGSMTGHQLDLALSLGRQSVERAKLERTSRLLLQAFGDEALAIAPGSREQPVPAPGCELVEALGRCDWMGLCRKTTVQHAAPIDAILARHAAATACPYEAMRQSGVVEVAILVGAMLSAAQLGINARALGVSACSAMAIALQMNASAAPWLRCDIADGASGRPLMERTRSRDERVKSEV